MGMESKPQVSRWLNMILSGSFSFEQVLLGCLPAGFIVGHPFSHPSYMSPVAFEEQVTCSYFPEVVPNLLAVFSQAADAFEILLEEEGMQTESFRVSDPGAPSFGGKIT